jgi:hypothetical protein
MGMLRIKEAQALPGLKLRLTLTDGSIIERDVAPLLKGPIFERSRPIPRNSSGCGPRRARWSGPTVPITVRTC